MRKVLDVKAVGSTVLVEMLSPQEAAGSELATTGKVTQARIVDLGPALDEKYGLKTGQRVLLQGTYNPVPKFPFGDERDLHVVDAHNIRCVFVEEPCCEKKKCCKVN